MSVPPIRRPSLRLRRTLLLVLFLVTFLVTFWVLLVPHLLRAQMENWLQRQGAEQAHIESLRISLWAGEVELNGLRAHRADQESLAVGHLLLAWSWEALLEGRLVVDNAFLARSRIPVDWDPESGRLQLGPVLIPQAGQAEGASGATPADDASATWSWGLRRLGIEELSLPLAWPQGRHHLQVQRLSVTDLYSWQPLRPSQVALHSLFDDSVLILDSEARPLAAQPDLNLAIQLEALELQPLLAPWLPEFKGQLSSDLHLQLRHDDTGWKLTQQGWLQLDDLSLHQEDLAIQQRELRWQGEVQLEIADDLPPGFAWQGALSVHDVQLDSPQAQLQLQAAEWRGDARLSAQQHLTQEATLQLAGLQGRAGAQQVKAGSVHWQGLSELDLAAAQPGWRWQGELAIRQFLARQAGQPELQGEAFSWSGELQGQGADWRGAGAASLQALLIQAGQPQRPWMRAGEIRTRLQAEGSDTVTLEGVSLQALQLGEPQQALLDLAEARLDRAHWDGLHLELGELSLQQLAAQLDIDASGEPGRWLAWQNALQSGVSEAQEPSGLAEQPSANVSEGRLLKVGAVDAAHSDAESDKAVDLSWRLAGLQLAGDNRIRLRDLSVRPAMKFEVSELSLELGTMDSRRVVAVPWRVRSRLNGSGEVDLQGSWAIGAETPEGHWAGTLKQLELPPLSPYSIRHIGYQLNSGRFNWEGDGEVSGGNLQSQNHLRMQSLRVSEADAALIASGKARLGMPLETALDILTDDDNNLDLQLPVNGALDDPEFGLQSLTGLLMGKVMSEAALGYLSHALQPYGALISLSRMALKAGKALSVNLQPLTFESGSTQLLAGEEAYLGKLAQLLSERQGLNLRLCGRAVAADREVLAQRAAEAAAEPAEAVVAGAPEATVAASAMPAAPAREIEIPVDALYSLATERASVVREALLSRKVPPARLFDCFAEVDLEDQEPPRLLLGF